MSRRNDGSRSASGRDRSDQVIDALEAGTVDFVSEQQPYLQGYMPVVVLSLYTKYGVLPANHVRTGPGFVTKDNLGKVKELAGTVRQVRGPRAPGRPVPAPDP